MSEDTERIRKLVEFKRKLEKRVEELESEFKEQQAVLEMVNSMLLEKGFRRAEIPNPPVSAETWPPKEEAEPGLETSQPTPLQSGSEDVVELKTTAGELLAILYVSENSLCVVPAEEKEFNVNTSPFGHFLVERVLVKMQERDRELARTGQLSPDKIFSYNILRDGDVIREITVENVDAARLRELKSSIRWTLEKMHEKAKSPN